MNKMTLHSRLIAKWNACEFGVKQRVFNDNMPQASVQYILSTPNYRDTEKIQWLIDCIDKHSKEFLDEVQDMYNQIESIK